MKSSLLQCFVGLFITLGAFANGDRRNSEVIVPASTAVLSAALERADVAVARSVITLNELKGGFAENLSNRFILGGNAGPGKWHAVSPRLGRQGFDHVAVRVDREGRPRGLLVGETKYRTSQLRTTKDGIQMGPRWTTARLASLASRLRAIHAQAQAEITAQPKPPNLNQRFEVAIPIDDQTSVKFWRHRVLDNEWKYDGPQELLPKAKTQLIVFSDYLNGAAGGKITFRRRIFVWKLKGDELLLTIRNADALQEGMSIASLPAQNLPPIHLSDARWAQDAFKKAYSAEILRTLPGISEKEALSLADDVYTVYAPAKSADGLLARRSFARFAAGQSLKAGSYGLVIAAPIELAFQAFGSEPVDWSRVASVSALSGGAAAAGTFTGNFATYGLMKSQFGNSMATRTAELVGLGSAGQVANLSGSVVGGGVASAIFAYGGYFLGYYDLRTANRSAFAGAVGTTSGVLASAATLSMVAAYGTAGTGVAISTLGGAAATNASLAVLGGGTVASGGFGVTGGAVVLGTGVGIIVVGVTGAVMYGFHLYDEAQNNKRIALTLAQLRAHYNHP